MGRRFTNFHTASEVFTKVPAKTPVWCILTMAASMLLPVLGNAQFIEDSDIDLITIWASQDEIELSGDTRVLPFALTEQGDWPTHGSFTVCVATLLPEWGVSIAAEPLQGPLGFLPPERIWVQTLETHGRFVPLAQDVPVMSSDEYLPVLESEVKLSVRPDWLDVAGSYSGQLVVNTHGPQGSGNYLHSVGSDESEWTRTEVNISFLVPQVISLSVSHSALSVSADGGPGTYDADSCVELTVSTNAAQWQVVCDALPFRHVSQESWIIPLERTRCFVGCGTPPRYEEWATLSETMTLFRGDAPAMEQHLCIIFAVEVLPTDPAGTYIAEVSLRGEVLPVIDLQEPMK